MRPLAIVLLIAIIGTSYAARLDTTYLPPSSAGSAGGAGLIHPPSSGDDRDVPVKYSGPVGFGSLGVSGAPSGHSSFDSGPNSFGGPSSHGGSSGFGPGGGGGTYAGGGHGQEIPIISYSSENIGDGNYQYSYETGNGISVQETGHQQGESESVSGSFSYTGPDGMQYSITYTADEYGFHPQGAHLPTPPPIPPEIQRGVELALAAEARGENQDGGYSHGRGGEGGNHGGHGGNVYQGPNSYQISSSGGYQY
ncbi:pupal cuticle protein 20 [Monomorium pharaonis]|uniref:pupal cuticle protein 20 n=1 Tax=Monomorium pharaonis TaxID=307658 RepID=UPI00063FC8F0|nr:pupal cuticle protein 20 [Monomorium pharaonis]XP_036144995.1 pupal cuticle protein 20 [Monomorium pharaonis]XP_036144996.1 pupal cuticle protein 20 [Monomorium pharaonis]